MEKAIVGEKIDASVVRGAFDTNGAMVDGYYHVVCHDADGNLKWEDTIKNLVTSQGKRHLLDHGLAGPATAVNTRLSLITSGSPVVGDTYATHAGFTEFTNIAARGTPSWSAAATTTTTDKATSAAVAFSINAGTNVNVIGCALNLIVGAVGNLGVISDTATANAILYSAGTFTTKTVSSGDTLNVTYTAQLAA